MQNVENIPRLGIPVKIAANAISMSDAFVWRLIDKKILKTFKFGKSVRIQEDSWEKFLKASERK